MSKKNHFGFFVVTAVCALVTEGSVAQTVQNREGGLRVSPVSYHLSFDNDDFFKEDIIQQSGKKTIEERKIDFPEARFGKGIRMAEIPTPPDEDNMTGIDLDLVTAVIFNTRPGNEMGYNQPFIWGGGRINARLGAVAFWAKGELPFSGPLFEQTSVSFGRKDRDLLGVVVGDDGKLSAYLTDARYKRHELKTDAVWDARQWNHIVFNWDWAYGMELWINGKRVGSSWNKQSWFETALPGLFHLPAAGVVYDELYLMDRPISENEIQSLIAFNTAPGDDNQHYHREQVDLNKIKAISGASHAQQLPQVNPGETFVIKEVWPESVSDGHIPGWYIMDGRNEMAWPHPYAMFTIIPGDADFHAEKVDIATAGDSKVNFITATGNLTNVGFEAYSARDEQPRGLFSVPGGDHFFYGSTINTTYGSTFRIPFTEEYGTPEGFSGDIHVPLSGEKRIQNVGLYHFDKIPSTAGHPYGKKLRIGVGNTPADDRSVFAIHALTSRDERKIALATSKAPEQAGAEVEIGAFERLNILSEPYNESTGIRSISLTLPIKTALPEEVLFIRVRDPGVPSRMWNQFAIRLQGFNDNFSRLAITIDFQDIVVTGGDRLWVDLAAAGDAAIRVGDDSNEAALFVEEAATYLSLHEYTVKEIVPANMQYGKMYEFMPWQFTGKHVSISAPYSYGGPFDMILPALAINRVDTNHFIANYLIRVSGPDYKDGKVINPENVPLVTLPNPDGAPNWAVYMRDFNRKRHAIADWWAEKQNPDGQLGGGWNDDVLFLSFHQPDLPLDGNENARYVIDAAQTGLEATRYFKDGYCNVYPMDRMHIGDFISERYNTIVNNLGQAYAFERELEAARWLGKPDEIPRNYYEDAFKSSVNAINWYWGKDVPEQPYRSKSLDELANEFQRYTSVLDEYAFYRFTGSNVHRDDFSPHGANNMYEYMLGGKRGTRLDAHLVLAVAWPSGGGPEVARVVLHADNTTLDVAAYSFDEKMRELAMRLMRIDDGTYRISILEDPHGTGEGEAPIWQTTKIVRRFDSISLPIPPKVPVVIKVEQLTPLKSANALADLAIDPWDVIFDNEVVTCMVHNIGNHAVGTFKVSLFDGDELLETQLVRGMEAPTDLEAKRTELTFTNIRYSGDLYIRVDPDNEIDEILEENNVRFVRKKGEVPIGIAARQ